MKVIATIQGCEILLHADGHCSMLADADIDCDGSGGDLDHDRYFKPDTSLHYNGKALNAYTTPFIVLPPVAIHAVGPIVLGCLALVFNRESGIMTYGVVGDVGPRAKVGEVSVNMAMRVELPHNPNTGGTSDFRQMLYLWWPGRAATIDNKTFQLQASR